MKVRYRITMVNYFSKNKSENGRKKSNNIQKCFYKDATQHLTPLHASIICKKTPTPMKHFPWLTILENMKKEINVWCQLASDNFLVFIHLCDWDKILVHTRIIICKTVSVSLHAEIQWTERALVLEIGGQAVHRRQGAGEGARGARPGVAAGRALFHTKALNMGMTFHFLGAT